MSLIDYVRIIASISTAVGIIIAAWQIWRNAEQAKTSFEDSLTKEYRDLIRDIPYEALIGKKQTTEKIKESREAIYNYLDFCNQQAYLRKQNRIREKTWQDWQEGIKVNLELPLFKMVLTEVLIELPSIFDELRHMQKDGFTSDPKKW